MTRILLFDLCVSLQDSFGSVIGTKYRVLAVIGLSESNTKLLASGLKDIEYYVLVRNGTRPPVSVKQERVMTVFPISH